MIAFVDDDVIEELQKLPSSGVKEKFPEHEFIASCLRLGLSIEDLKQMTYVDAMKIILSCLDYKEKENKSKIASQEDIDNFLG